MGNMIPVSRRDALVTDPSRWVFNRLAADYRHRPPYPAALVERLLALAGGAGARVADLGAGTGHLAVPLARLGARVHAVEPARAMLDALVAAAEGLVPAPPSPRAAGLGRGLPVVPVHAAAEETGLAAAAFDLVLLADALHWVDPDRGGREVARLLAPAGALAVVVPSFADTPFQRALADLVAASNPKARPRPPPVGQLCAVAGLPPPRTETFADEALLDDEGLAAVIRSLSYAGPALGPAGLERLLEAARALARAHGGARWSRVLTLDHTRRSSPDLLGPAERGRGWGPAR